MFRINFIGCSTLKLVLKQILDNITLNFGHRVLNRILKVGVKMLSAEKNWSFPIPFYWTFEKVGVGVK